MSNITDFIKTELYPTLFDSIDIAFPEHNFKQYAGGWRSKTYLNGTPHKEREDKTVISKKAPGLILENGGEVVGLVDYVIKRDSVDFIKAVKTLANIVGLELPINSDFNSEDYKKYRDQATLLEDCNSYFIYCIENSTGAKDVLKYLKDRGYTTEDIKLMEIGYIPDQEKTVKYLLSKNYSQALIDEVLKLNIAIGSTHKLTIPYRSGGLIKGFKFRTIGDTTPKYLNSSGLDKIGGFFNLSGIKGDKDVIIVEGELDSLHATIKGVNNIVSTGGSSINSEQIKDAVKRGAKSFTLCFDTEPGKEETTAKNINKGIEVILGEGVNKVYIVTLPEIGGDKTDPDRLIKESGVEVFKKLIAQAIPYYIYKLECIINKYNSIDNITYKELKSFEEEIVETGASIKEPTDKDSYLKQAIKCFNEIGITEESLAIAVDRLTSTRDKEAQAKDFKKLLTEATALQDKGDIDKALELIDSRVKDVKLKDKATEFNSLLLPIKETELRERQAKKPDSLKTGYNIGGEELLLPAGAISIFTAPTSHGKTTFLINLALNVSQAYPDKETYLFSYEEDSDSVLISALNTYLDTPLSNNNRTTLKNYFTGNNKVTLSDNKDKFFKELIDTRRLNIHYSNYNSDTLIEAIRYLHKNTNIGSVFIDYIQLLNLPESKKNRQEQLKEICISLKDLAVETGLPIILGSQFNRTVTNLLQLHSTKIGEAGDIERIANLIVGFWNNNFPPIATEGELKEIDSKGGNNKDTIYTKILKQRGGKVGGEELLSFNGNTGKIKNNTTDTTESYFK